MPAFATHYFFAKDILDSLDEDVQERLKKYRRFFDLGAQGPDIFLFYKPYKKNNIAEYGVSLHKKQVKRFIEEAIPRIKEYDDEAALIYLLGYVTHFTLDSSFHSYINNKYKDFNEHMSLETQLDYETILNRSKIAPYKFRRYLLINPRTKYGPQLHLIYPTITNNKLDEAVYQTNLYMKILYSPNNIKGKFISFLCKRFKKVDFSNLIIKKEVNSKYTDDIKILMAEYDSALEQGKTNILNLLNYYDGSEKKLNQYFYKSCE